MWETAEAVARCGIDGLAKGHPVAIPGTANRVAPCSPTSPPSASSSRSSPAATPASKLAPAAATGLPQRWALAGDHDGLAGRIGVADPAR